MESVSIVGDPYTSTGSVTFIALDIDGNEIFRNSAPDDGRTYTIDRSMTAGGAAIHKFIVFNPAQSTAFETLTFVSRVESSSDADGVVDRLDLDSDNDGIGDNIEAQSTAGYMPPSGQGTAMVDADRDGLDDRYDANTADASAAASVGLLPVNTDQDSKPDYLDDDSDGDGRADVTERGDGQAISVTNLNDQDGDGLLDVFEHGSPGDGYYVHDDTVSTSGTGLATTVTTFNLADSDDDTATDGSDAVALSKDLNWRDIDPSSSRAPLIDLNSSVSSLDGTSDFRAETTGGSNGVNVAARAADVSDLSENDLAAMSIVVSGVQDGDNEILNLAGMDFVLNSDATRTVTVDGFALQVSYTVTGGFAINSASGLVIPESALDTLVRGITYRNERVDATTGARTLTFVATDSDGISSGEAVSTIDVSPNSLPVARDDAVIALEDQPATGNVLLNDSDPDAGDLLAVTEFTVNGSTFVAGSSATLSGVGAITVGTDGSFVFTPELHYDGPVPPVQYAVRDPKGSTASAELAITIAPQNDAPAITAPPGGDPPGQTFDPSAGRYAASTMEDAPIAGQVAASDPEGDTLTYALVEGPSNGTLTMDAATGAFAYTPTADFNGIDSFVFTVSDGQGGSTQARVDVAVTPVADALDDAITTQEDTPVILNVNDNDSFENPSHTISAINGNPIAVGQRVTVSNGSVLLDEDGTLEFTPVRDFNGSTSFTYTVTSGGVPETARVTVDVTAVNDPPRPMNPGSPVNPGGGPGGAGGPGTPGGPGEPGGAGAVPGQNFNPDTGNFDITTPRDTPFAGRVGGFDPDGDPLTFTVGGNPGNGTVVLQPDGSYSYTPNPGYAGGDSFVIVIDDGNGGSVSTTVFVTITNVIEGRNDYPHVFYPEGYDAGIDHGSHNLRDGLGDVDRGDLGDWGLDADLDVYRAVNSAQTLDGTRDLSDVSGVALRAVNGVDSLQGTVPLSVRGAVLQAVNGVDPLNSIDTYDRQPASALERAAQQADRADSTRLGIVASLRTGQGLMLELSGDQRHAWLSVDAGMPVRELRATLGDGRALPAWVRVDRGGLVAMDRPADAQKLRMRLTVVPEHGASRSITIELDFDAGQMRVVGSRDAQRASAASAANTTADATHPHAASADFATQLGIAARPRVNGDAELTDLLRSLELVE